MSCTLTIDIPATRATASRKGRIATGSPLDEFGSRNVRMTTADLGELFLMFLAEHCAVKQEVRQRRADDSALAQWDRLVLAGKGRLKKPYRFSRSDAYDEKLA